VYCLIIQLLIGKIQRLNSPRKNPEKPEGTDKLCEKSEKIHHRDSSNREKKTDEPRTLTYTKRQTSAMHELNLHCSVFISAGSQTMRAWGPETTVTSPTGLNERMPRCIQRCLLFNNTEHRFISGNSSSFRFSITGHTFSNFHRRNKTHCDSTIDSSLLTCYAVLQALWNSPSAMTLTQWRIFHEFFREKIREDLDINELYTRH
jgi:hypothetical protein